MIFITLEIQVIANNGKIFYLKRNENDLWNILNDTQQIYSKNDGFVSRLLPSHRDDDYMKNTLFDYDEAREILLKLNKS